MTSLPALLGLATLTLISVGPSSRGVTASATSVASSARAEVPADQEWFLAIGDSITFGSSAEPGEADRHSAWPLQLAGMLTRSGQTWTADNVSCPGETAASYRGMCVFRSLVPRLALGISQREAALAEISRHRSPPRFVVVALGANDVAVMAGEHQDVVVALAALDSNLSTILTELRTVAPGVPLVVANVYDYLGNRSPDVLSPVELVNADIAAVAARQGAALADFYSAIEAPPFTREAFCLNVDCAHSDIHPTPLGQSRLARAVLAALGPTGILSPRHRATAGD